MLILGAKKSFFHDTGIPGTFWSFLRQEGEYALCFFTRSKKKTQILYA